MNQDTSKTFKLMPATIPIRLLRPLWGVLTESNRLTLRDQLFEKFNLNKKRLMSDERIPLDMVLIIFSFCEDNSTSEAGFLTGLSSKYGQFGVIDYYLSSMQTLGEMLKALKHYFPILSTETSQLEIKQINNQQFQLSLPKYTGSVQGEKLFCEMLLGILIRTIYVHSGNENLLPALISFPYINLSKPIVLYLTNQKIKVQLNKSEYQLIYPTNLLTMELQYRDKIIRKQLEPIMDELLLTTQGDETITSQIVTLFNHSNDLSRLSLVNIADELSMSQSSLKRKLADEGSSFSYLLSRYKQSQAMEMVTGSKSKLSDVAKLLGYADRTAFERAFKEWFSVTPSQIRQQILTSNLPHNISNPIDSNNFPVAPNVYLELISMLDSDDNTIDDIANLIETDPVLTGKLLGIANSAYYGYREITNISSAISELFGLSQTRNFVLAIMSNNQFDTSACKLLDLQLFWTHATATYECIKMIASAMQFSNQVERERFCLAALLHRIFELVYASQRPDDMSKYMQALNENDLIIDSNTCQEIEEQIFGIKGYETTAFLLAQWGLPVEIHKTIRDMSMPVSQQTLSAKVLNYVSDSFRYTIYSDAKDAQKDLILENLSSLLSLEHHEIEQKISQIENSLAEINDQAKSMF